MYPLQALNLILEVPSYCFVTGYQIYLLSTMEHIMIIYVLFLALFQAAMACSSTLPNVQVVVKVNNDNPPLVSVFNVPLFDNDCFYQLPAKAVNTDGE